MHPSTRYTRSGDLNIAYQVVGDGPIDIVYVPGWVSNLDYAWELPRLVHVFERLSAFARLILFDKHGTGLSDRNVGFPTLVLQLRLPQNRDSLLVFDGREFDVGFELVWISGGLAAGARYAEAAARSGLCSA
ncbi:alpha/beta fold hydrolase [Rhizobium herbae]